MTVTLTNPDPDPPEAGKSFSIDAADGTGPYEWKYKIGNGPTLIAPQTGSTLTIDIPRGTAGQTLCVNVMDGNDDGDGWSATIS